MCDREEIESSDTAGLHHNEHARRTVLQLARRTGQPSRLSRSRCACIFGRPRSHAVAGLERARICQSVESAVRRGRVPDDDRHSRWQDGRRPVTRLSHAGLDSTISRRCERRTPVADVIGNEPRISVLKRRKRCNVLPETLTASANLHGQGFNTVFGWRLRYSYWRELETQCTGGKDHETNANR